MSWDNMSQWLTSLPASWQMGLWFVLGSYALSLVLVFVIVLWLPDNYVLRESRWYRDLRRAHPWLFWIVALVKNALGLVLVVAGIAMLFLPGQGLLTLLFGVVLVDFPGKHALILKLLAYPVVLKSINRIRCWAGRRPLRLPDEPR